MLVLMEEGDTQVTIRSAECSLDNREWLAFRKLRDLALGGRKGVGTVTGTRSMRRTRFARVMAGMTVLLVVFALTAPPASAKKRHPRCAGKVVTIAGTHGTDVIEGTSGDDVIKGRSGGDVIHGNGGNDTICGDGGSDTIDTTNGDDWIFGGAGDDAIYTGLGSDVVNPGPGTDLVNGITYVDGPTVVFEDGFLPPTYGTLTSSPASINFGSVAVGGASAPVDVVVTNIDDVYAAVLDTDSSVSSIVVGQFSSSVGTCTSGAVLAPGGGSCTFSVWMTPTFAGSIKGTASLNDPTGPLWRLVLLSGTGV